MKPYAEDIYKLLDEQAAALERMLDNHPGRHLLAEYETSVLENANCTAEDALALLEKFASMIYHLTETETSAFRQG